MSAAHLMILSNLGRFDDPTAAGWGGGAAGGRPVVPVWKEGVEGCVWLMDV